MPSQPPVIQERKHDGACEPDHEPHRLIDGVGLPVVRLGCVDSQNPDPTEDQGAEEEEHIGAAQPVRDAYLLRFLAPGDGDRRTGPCCSHGPKIQNLSSFGNVLPNERRRRVVATLCARRTDTLACGQCGAWRVYCCPTEYVWYARRSLINPR